MGLGSEVPRRGLFIDGEWVEPIKGKRIPVINPTTEEPCGEFLPHIFMAALHYGRWVLNGYFLQLAHFSWDMKHTISLRWLVNPNQGPSDFPYIFGAHMSILFIFKVKICMLIKSLSRSPQLW